METSAMESKLFIIELVKYGAWPLVTCVIAYVLKDRVSGIFGGGIKSAKHGDTEFQFYENNQHAKPIKLEDQDLTRFIPVDTTGIRTEVEAHITNDLTKIDGEKDKIDILVKNLAQQQIINTFEKVYFNIFGSQIQVLEYLSVQNNGQCSVKDILPIFESAKQKNTKILNGVQFSDYMQFLLSWDLVKNDEDKWIITKHGRAFLNYISAMRLDKNKVA